MTQGYSFSSFGKSGATALIPIPMPGLQVRLSEIFPMLDALCRSVLEMSLEQQNEYQFWDTIPDPTDPKPDLGIFNRSLKEGMDRKVFVHYSPEIYRHLDANLRFWELDDVLRAAESLYEFVLARALSTALELEHTFGLPGFHKKGEGFPCHKLRFLWYLDQDGVTAKEHTDRSCLTFHLGETHPGLVVNGEVQTVKPDTVLLFPGKRFSAQKPGCLSEALPHSVKVAQIEGDARRMSAIFFFHVGF